MIQTRTALCVIAAVASGLFLYSEKRQALLIDRETGGLMRATADLRTRTALLRAEWAAMLEPDRLATIIAGRRPLQPITPSQFVQLGELGAHLPPPDASASSTSPDADGGAPESDDAAASIVQGEPAPAAGPAQPAAAPSPAPNVLASAVPPHHAQHRPAIAGAGALQAVFVPAGPKAPPRSLSVKHGLTQHSLTQHSLALAGAPERLFAQPRPLAANAYKVIARQAGIVAAPAQAPSQPAVASALGNGVALSPPIPYGQ